MRVALIGTGYLGLIFDGRNQYDAKRVRDYGLEYLQIGVQPLQVKEAAR